MNEFSQKLEIELIKANTSPNIASLISNWSKEILPDFMGWCTVGILQSKTLFSILSVRNPFKIDPQDSHPFPFVRSLIIADACERVWGKNTQLWSDWKSDWLQMYPIPSKVGKIVQEILRLIPIILDVLFKEKFVSIQGRQIIDLFDLKTIHPKSIEERLTKTKDIFQLNSDRNNISIQILILFFDERKKIVTT